MSQNKTNKKLRTLAYPHRVFNKASIFLLKTEAVTTDGLLTYIGRTVLENEMQLKVQSKVQLSAHDAKIFDYVLSRIQAIGLTTNTKLSFFTKELIDEMGEVDRTENRDKIYKSLTNLINTTIELSFDGDVIQFELLEEVKQIDRNFELEVNLSRSFIDTMNVNVAKTRYVSIGQTMKSKNQYTIELAKLLQIDGQGVSKKGEPLTVKEITHQRICQYLFLDVSTASSRATLRKAFNELEGLKYSRYKYNGRKNSWQKVVSKAT